MVRTRTRGSVHVNREGGRVRLKATFTRGASTNRNYVLLTCVRRCSSPRVSARPRFVAESRSSRGALRGRSPGRGRPDPARRSIWTGMERIPDALAHATVLDESAAPQPLASLWAKRPMVLVFVRHFG
jgi:hypothetical protein